MAEKKRTNPSSTGLGLRQGDTRPILLSLGRIKAAVGAKTPSR